MRTHAQSDRLLARASFDAATMMSGDQLGRLHYDRPGLLGGLQLGYSVLPRLDLQIGAQGGGFLSSSRRAGGLVAPTLGLNVHALPDGLTPYAFAEAGVGITGTLTRPFFRLGVGLDIPVSRRVALGPAAGYAQLVQNDKRKGSSTDASYIWAGLSLLYRHIPPASAPAATERVVVVHHTHQVPTPMVEPPAQDLMELLDKAIPSATARVELLAPVLFAFDSDVLEPVGVAMLHEVAHELSVRPDIQLVSIQGYADSRGSPEYNRALSQKRAERVLEWLVEHGVDRARLQTEAEGATAFVEPGVAEPEHQQNRRVVFRVLKAVTP